MKSNKAGLAVAEFKKRLHTRIVRETPNLPPDKQKEKMMEIYRDEAMALLKQIGVPEKSIYPTVLSIMQAFQDGVIPH
jgi:hypothetical protein